MILITGASGLLGANILQHALAMNREVAGVCYRHPLKMNGALIYSVDLTDFCATQKLIVGLRPSSIIHCAAATNVDWCEDHSEEAETVNASASGHLAQLACDIGARFIQISSDSVFDGIRGNYSEKDPPAPLNVYARTKLLAEKEVLAAHPDSIIVRVTFYGWSNLRHKPSLAEWILNQLKHGLDVPGFTDVFFCPILANDLAGILLEMHDRELSGVYHVVGSEKISKYEFAVRLAKLFGFDPARVLRSSIDAAKLGAPRPKDTSLDCNKISEALGRSMPDVDAGLRRFKEAGESAKFLEFSCAVGGDE